jgi:flagellar biosynthesis component FlhA
VGGTFNQTSMKQVIPKLLCIVFAVFLICNGADCQQKKAGENAKKKEKVERSYKKAYAKARKKTIKHRREIQTDATKERMDAADKRAEAYNKQNDPTFIERYFKRKRPVKR